jgi:hypothetical protein
MYQKWQMILRKSPEIVIFGLSRAYQFRSAFFKDKEIVYNASAQYKLPYYKDMLSTISPGKEPKIVIITLEQHFFNPKSFIDATYKDFEKEVKYSTPFKERIKLGGVGVQKDILLGNSFFKLLKGRKKGYIGLEAFLKDTGTRKDGSYAVNTDDIHKTAYDRFKEVYRQIDRGELMYKYSDEVSMQAVSRVDELLKYCRSRNIYVIGILPPYPHVVYEKMLSDKMKYKYVFDLESTLKPVFSKYLCRLYDFTDLQKTGAGDLESYDGSHGSEKSYVRMFMLIARQDPVLGKYVDNNFLAKRLEASKNDFTVFDMDE